MSEAAIEYISQSRYEEILSGGNQAELDALMSGRLVFDETVEPENNGSTEQENKSGEISATPSAESSSNAEIENTEPTEIVDGVKPKILSKNGQHTIEFEVLEYEREQKKAERAARIAAETELNNLRAKFGEKQAEVATITQEEALFLTDEEVAQLEELDPLAGKMAKHFKAQQLEIMRLQKIVESKPEVIQPTQNTPNVNPVKEYTQDEVQEAIDSNPQLLTWQARDPKAFRMAGTIDQELSDDPSYLALPLADRYQLVVERTNAALGRQTAVTKRVTPVVDVDQRIAELEANDRPNSLSNIGVSPSTEKSISERLTGMTQFEMLDAMSQLSDADLDRVLRNEI